MEGRSSAWGKFRAVDAPLGQLFAGTSRSVFQGALGGDATRRRLGVTEGGPASALERDMETKLRFGR